MVLIIIFVLVFYIIIHISCIRDIFYIETSLKYKMPCNYLHLTKNNRTEYSPFNIDLTIKYQVSALFVVMKTKNALERLNIYLAKQSLLCAMVV